MLLRYVPAMSEELGKIDSSIEMDPLTCWLIPLPGSAEATHRYIVVGLAHNL